MGETPITAQYRDAAIQRAIRQALKQDPRLPIVALGAFLTPAAFRAIDRNARTGWRRAGIPDRGLYATRSALSAQRAIRAYTRALTRADTVQEPNRRFGHRDFTLLHDHEQPTPGWRAFLFLDDLPVECGGQLVFSADGETLGAFAPRENTLLLVRQRRGVHAFFQYVNHRAGKRTVRVLSC